MYPGELVLDSPPAMLNDTLVVGSAMDDMTRALSPGADVWALDVRTGATRWRFDPDSGGGHDRGWQAAVRRRQCLGADRGRCRAEPGVPADGLADRGVLGRRTAGRDLFSSAVVALDGATGRMVWRFQTTHHDIWDYDVAAQPTLATVQRDGREVPVVVVATKMGFLFVLDRMTGQPVFPVTEQPVPASDVPGEAVSPTQPIPSAPPPLVPQILRPEDAFGVAVVDRLQCRRRIEQLRSDGLYTPPSLRGSVIYPFTGGGANWGGGAFDPASGLFVINTMNLAHVVRLIPRADMDAARQAAPKAEIGRGIGTPYAAERTLLTSIFGHPVQQAAVGDAGGGRSERGRHSLAGAAWAGWRWGWCEACLISAARS